jgi:hypothetical protein
MNTRRLDILLTIVVVLIVTAPLLFTNSGFGVDFTNHMWLAWIAGKALVQAGHPSYFMNAEGLGAFYPTFAFYGGTLYTATGALSELLGSHGATAFAAVIVLAVAASYTGTLWLGRQLGLRDWTAHAPALAVVTSAYYITNLYGRGAWPEFMATAALAPLVAAGVWLVRARRWRPVPVLVFTVSTVVFSGSHNITLEWGATMLALALLMLWLAFGAPLDLPYRRLAAVASLGLTSMLVNAWFLLPDIAYAHDVIAGNGTPFRWGSTSFFNTPAVLLDPLRHVPSQSSTPTLFIQAPDWFLVWGLTAGALLLWRRPAARGLRHAWIAVAVLVTLLLGMMMAKPFWEVVPFPFDEIQFPYRLGSYLFYAVAGLVLLGALGLQRAASTSPRRTINALRLALVGVSAVSLGLCVWQLWVPNTLVRPSYRDRAAALASVNVVPHSWYDHGVYHDVQAPPVTTPLVATPGERVLIIEPDQVKGDRFEAWMNVPPGPQPIQTNIAGGQYLVHISGLQRVGRGARNDAVVRRIGGGSGPVHVVVETNHSFLIDLAWVLSAMAILAILAVVIACGVSVRRPQQTGDIDSHSVRPPAMAGDHLG